ncbi:MAG: hypothetical protein AAGA29_12685 [Planctomycetota bacterium]
MARQSEAIAAGLQEAWETYRWAPLPEQTQAAAWTRLLSFTQNLLGAEVADANPVAEAMAAQTLQRWLHIIRLSPDDAIAWLLNPDAEPDPLLDQLEQAAIAEATSQIAEMNMRLAYDMQPIPQRVACAQRMRDAFPIVGAYLPGIPAWALADELPALHGLCLQELQQRSASHAVEGEDIHGQQSHAIAYPTHQRAEAFPLPGGVPGQG